MALTKASQQTVSSLSNEKSSITALTYPGEFPLAGVGLFILLLLTSMQKQV